MSEEADAAAPPQDASPGLYGPDGRPQFFNDPTTDRFVATLLNLASEVWVQEERILTLEGKAAGHGTTPPDRDAMLKAFIARVFAPLREEVD